MQNGRRLKSPESKKLAGTFTKHRDANTAPIVEVVRDHPVAPDWMTEGGKAVWKSDFERVVATGTVSVDANFFAVYCETMATYIAALKAGSPPNAAYLSELRKQMFELSIAGPKSRLAKLAGDPGKSTNPFAAFR